MTDNKKIYGYVYKIENLINQKIYIGKVEQERFEKLNEDPIKGRWEEHLKDAEYIRRERKLNPNNKIWKSHLNNAIIMYGSENFTIKEIDKADNLEDLNNKERYWIKSFNSMNPDIGYNMIEGGDFGRIRPEIRDEINKKISKAQIETWKDPEYREKQRKAQSKAMKERWKDNEYKNKKSIIAHQLWNDPEYREKQKIAHSIAQKELWKDPEYREKLSKAHSIKQKEIWKNPEYKEKQSKAQSKAQKKLWNNPEYKKKMSEIRKETWKNPDYREKISKSVSIAKKKEIRNEKEFILDIGSSRKVHELIEKYNMSNSTINKKIKEILNHLGLKNYRDVKNYLKSHDIEDILKNLN